MDHQISIPLLLPTNPSGINFCQEGLVKTAASMFVGATLNR
jgi:hypothetical protein